MTTTTLEKPQTNSSGAPQLSIPAPCSVNQVIRGGSNYQQEPAHNIEVGVKQVSGWLSRPVRWLKDGAFQLGLTAPGRLWYRNSAWLTIKGRPELDAYRHGYFPL